MALRVRANFDPSVKSSEPQTAEELHQQIDEVRYISELRGKKLGPRMARALMHGGMSLEQFDATMEKVIDKRNSLRVTPGDPPEAPPEAEPQLQERFVPTANLGEPRTDFDAAERAAGEHLDRER